MRSLPLFGLVLLALACPPEPEPPPDREPDVEPVPDPVSITLEPGGTTATVAGVNGAVLTLELPAGAIRAPVDVVITPLASSEDAPLAFSVSPAGLQLRTPATLTVQSDDVALDRATAAWRVDDELSPLDAEATSNSLTARILSLGPPNEDETTAEQRVGFATGGAAPTATFVVNGRPMSCDEFIRHQVRLADVATTTGNPSAASYFWDSARMFADFCPGGDAALIDAEQRLTCEKLVAAVDNADVIAADSYRNLLRTVGAIIAAQGAVQLTDATCNVDPSATIDAKLAQAITFFQARFSTAQLSGDLEAELDMLDELLAFDGACQLAALDVCGPLIHDLYPPVLDAIRAGAWDSCQQTGFPTLLGVLFGDALGSARTGFGGTSPGANSIPAQGSSQPYMTFADYSYSNLEDDISSCASTFNFHRFDDDAVPVEVLPPPAPLGPGAKPGTTQHEKSMEIFLDGSLTIGGNVPLPHCPGGGSPGGALIAQVVGTEVGRATAGATHYSLDVRPLAFATTDLVNAANGATSFDLDLVRVGTACTTATYTDPWIVARLHLSAVAPPAPMPLEGRYVGTGVYCSENGCDSASPLATTLTISTNPAGTLQAVFAAAVSGSSIDIVSGIPYLVTRMGDTLSGSCQGGTASCSESLAFSGQIMGTQITGFAEWEAGCGPPGCKITFDVTREGP